MKKNQKHLDNFRHRKTTLKVQILPTADNQKQFEVLSIKNLFFSEFTHLEITSNISVDQRDLPKPWTLQYRGSFIYCQRK